jgi:hypothetical protein
VKYYISGSRAAFTTKAPDDMRMAAGKEIRGVIDFGAMKETLLIPISMGSMPGMKMVIDLNKTGNSDDKKTYTLKNLGTTETVAGLSCEDYEIDADGKPDQRVCMSKSAGRFAMGMMGNNNRNGGAWMAVMGQHPDMFPLKVSNADGTIVMEVTSVQQQSVPAEMFMIPDGYMEMPSMGGRGGGN